MPIGISRTCPKRSPIPQYRIEVDRSVAGPTGIQRVKSPKPKVECLRFKTGLETELPQSHQRCKARCLEAVGDKLVKLYAYDEAEARNCEQGRFAP